jgi:hypothetical protein
MHFMAMYASGEVILKRAEEAVRIVST